MQQEQQIYSVLIAEKDMREAGAAGACCPLVGGGGGGIMEGMRPGIGGMPGGGIPGGIPGGGPRIKLSGFIMGPPGGIIIRGGIPTLNETTFKQSIKFNYIQKYLLIGGGIPNRGIPGGNGIPGCILPDLNAAARQHNRNYAQNHSK